MPASRKRIGFLPSAEVQDIINEICIKSKLSQSKVTGILVEEALNARNLYNCKDIKKKRQTDVSHFYKTEKQNKLNAFVEDNKSITNDKEYKLIKEYLNYKNFKMILSIVEKENQT